MKKFLLIPTMTLTILLSMAAGTCLAEKVYITDSFDVTFRSGPSTTHKIIQMLKSGQELESLRSEDGWTLVRLTRGSGEGIEGWVLDRYLIRRQPWEMQAMRLRAENDGVRNKLTSIEADWTRLKEQAEGRRTELAASGQKLETLRQEYDRLKEGASEYLELRQEHLEMKTQFEEGMEQLQSLTEENRVLRSMERTKWFATGGAVLLCGLIIGLIFGRREKKKRSSYY